MPRRVLHATDAAGERLREQVDQIRTELEIDADFPAEVLAAAEAAAGAPRMPDLDRTDLALVTIDPATARDLDQALHLERDPERPDGYVVHYAIADVAAFVSAGDPVDVEAHRRGETLYGADSTVPLHPPALSEDAASLLPDAVRPALLWTVHLDAEGEEVDARLERARVRSREQLSYEEAQRRIDSGEASESLVLLREVGEKRLAREAARGGISLPLPDQQVAVEGDRWTLELRTPLPVEQWNAQVSLLTGMAGAAMMVYARVGILRTLPPAGPGVVQQLHRTARGLGLTWPAEVLPPDFIRGLDPSVPAEAAMVLSCTGLLRGASYVAFDDELPDQPVHAGLASEYAHVTAPLRRLVDRYGLEVCLALSEGRAVPGWVLEALPGLPETMRRSGALAGRYERALLDLVEAALLQHRVGETFTGVVVDVDDERPTRGTVQLADQAVSDRVSSESPLPLGEQVEVRLTEADVATRTVEFVH